MQERAYNNIRSYSLWTRLWNWLFLAIVAIAAIREKIRYSHVPAPLRGLGLHLSLQVSWALGL